jgi:hypothetical protein
MLSRVLALGLVAVVAGGTSAAFAQSSTIRIEPRPVYGATVTIEEGVRVFRPLPPEKYVVVNPNGTPVNIGLSEQRVFSTSRSTSRNVHRHTWRDSGYIRCHPAVGNSC